jgi:hypothetical protein
MRNHHQQLPTIAILGGNPVVANALALLLEDAGFDTRILEEPSAHTAGEQLNGVDLLLLPPVSSEGNKEGSLGAIEATPATADVPILKLSTAPKEELNDRTGMMPWPALFEDLRRAIEAILAPALAPAEGER